MPWSRPADSPSARDGGLSECLAPFVLDSLDFLARVLKHITDKNKQRVTAYGVYSNRGPLGAESIA